MEKKRSNHSCTAKGFVSMGCLAVLAACGGGGSDEPQNAQAGGIFRSSLDSGPTNAPTLFGAIDENGVARFVEGTTPGQFNQQYIVAPGLITPTGNTFTVPYTEYFEPNGTQSGGTLSGTVSSRSNIVIQRMVTGGSTDTFNLIFDASDYSIPASFSLLTGSWTFAYGGSNVNGELSFDSAGAISGSDSAGCVYTGGLSIPDARYDAFEVSLNSSCSSGAMTGLAAYFPANGSQSASVLFIVNNSQQGLGVDLVPAAGS